MGEKGNDPGNLVRPPSGFQPVGNASTSQTAQALDGVDASKLGEAAAPGGGEGSGLPSPAEAAAAAAEAAAKTAKKIIDPF